MEVKKFFTIKLLKHILVYLVIISLPVFAKWILNAAVPVYVILIIITVKFIFKELSLLNIKHIFKIVCRILSVGISVLFAIILLASIIITPVSIYSFFFEQAVNPLTEEYFVATLFVLLVTFFCLFFGSSCLKQNSLKPLLGLLSMICGLLLIIYQTIFYLFLLIAGLFIYIAVIMKKRIIALVAVFTICIIISFLLFITWNKPEGNSFVDNYLFPETRNFINNTFPEFPLLIDIPGYGMNYRTGRLGGRALLTSAPVFEVQGTRKETVYLKTSIYDRYTGYSWQQSETIIYDPGTTFRDPSYVPDPRDPSYVPDPRDPGSGILTIKVLSEVFSMVPYTIDTSGFTYNRTHYNITSGKYIPGIAFSAGIKKNSTITLYRNEKQRVVPENLNLFLQVPGDLPESIKRLSNMLGQNASSKQAILYNIQAFLASYYTYNLDTPVVHKDEDFLDNFLFRDKQGYCTHFATAFTIFARLNKIPTRYVSGYLVYITDDSYKKTVTARTAHAWPEIWLPDKGWEIWESTHAVNRNYYDTYLESIYYRYMFESMIQGNEIARNRLTLNQLEDLLGIELKFEEEEKQSFAWMKKTLSVLLYIFLITLSLCITGSLLYLFIRFILNRKPERYWKVLLNRIVKSFRQAPPPEKKGWIYWKNNLCSIYMIEEEQADALLAVILKLAYSQNPVSRDEISVLKGFNL